MTKARKTKYLTYIEDTPKYHYVIKNIARKSGENALIESRSNDIAVTFLEGSNIVRESPNGTIEVIKEVGTTHRKVKVGSRTTIYKGKKD
tara:strand:+ start:642 stop:911 length:270 start_codon:yes stop_codon:yes gene_type:complete